MREDLPDLLSPVTAMHGRDPTERGSADGAPIDDRPAAFRRPPSGCSFHLSVLRRRPSRAFEATVPAHR
jgi:hypothetical protein